VKWPEVVSMKVHVVVVIVTGSDESWNQCSGLGVTIAWGQAC